MKDDIDLVAKTIQKYSGHPKSRTIKNQSIYIHLKSVSYQVTRLNDEQYKLLRKNTLSIAQDYAFLMYLYSNENLIYRSFSRMYATLKHLFGESGGYYDDWKGSFSFPFLICFERDGQDVEYLINVYNFRSAIEFSLYKLISSENQEYDKMVIHKPFPEFIKEQINIFLICFIGNLTDFFEKNLHGNYEAFFYKTAQSNLIIFGHQNGEFFDLQFDDPDEFEAKREELARIESLGQLSNA